MKKSQIIKLVLSLILCLSAGFIGSIFTRMSVDTWYKTIIKPSFNPPNWLFAPVWTILFILIGLSLYRIWEYKITYSKSKALLIFYLQLFANVCWSIAFFGLRSPLAGLIVIIILLVLIIWTIFRFYEISKTAAALLIPYLLWVSFAAILNLRIFMLN